MVPRILTHDQKQRRLHISSDLLRNADMFDRVITVDETWCFQYDPKTKRQSMKWKTQNSPQPEKSTHVSVAGQDHACVFLRSQGIVQYEFIAQGQTVNQQCYLEVLTRLGNLFRGKDLDSSLISGFSTVKMPLRMMR